MRLQDMSLSLDQLRPLFFASHPTASSAGRVISSLLEHALNFPTVAAQSNIGHACTRRFSRDTRDSNEADQTPVKVSWIASGLSPYSCLVFLPKRFRVKASLRRRDRDALTMLRLTAALTSLISVNVERRGRC